jgi:uncharacterized damage-inducible protein DinB
VEGRKRRFDYDAWANREAHAAMVQAARKDGSGRAPGRSAPVLAHVLAAGRLWHERLVGARPSGPVWPAPELERLGPEIDDLARRWEGYFGSLAPADLAREVEYVNSKGEPWRSAVGDVLDHVLLHGAYHRGQIASDLRAAGCEPAYTDFIHAVRSGRLG